MAPIGSPASIPQPEEGASRGRFAVSNHQSPPDHALWEALQDVTDPEFPLSVVDMGLIYGLRREGEKACVALTFTAMGCPCMEFIIEDIRARLMQEPGIGSVEITIIWDPPWTKRRLTEKGVERLRRCGVTI